MSEFYLGEIIMASSCFSLNWAVPQMNVPVRNDLLQTDNLFISLAVHINNFQF